jgi:predicted LPLAT superfamily acyltransferase
MNRPIASADWSARREIGSMPVLRLAVRVALCLGRPLTRLLLLPICMVFAVTHAQARAASRQYLVRVLSRPPRATDVLKHFLTFATTVLDRIYLLNDDARRFQITIHGEHIVTEILAQGGGCLLLGAHHGSFEVLRLVGRRQPDLHISLAMYEETGRKIGAALNAINPDAVPRIIGLGTTGAMIEIRDCLEQGGFVGMLADRTLPTDSTLRFNFLGTPASFPTGPARLAGLLRPPVVLMVGLFEGGNRYHIHFELLAPSPQAKPDPDDTTRLIARYVTRLEHYCRTSPYNWFNFFDFWA